MIDGLAVAGASPAVQVQDLRYGLIASIVVRAGTEIIEIMIPSPARREMVVGHYMESGHAGAAECRGSPQPIHQVHVSFWDFGEDSEWVHRAHRPPVTTICWFP